MKHETAPVGIEALRQQALVASFSDTQGDTAMLGLRETGERAARGLEAYRANAQMLADRALTAGFGTVQAMVGAEDFAHLAWAFWRAHPPLQGDIGEWGHAFPAWLAAHPALAAWPYLGDSARLDLALHRNERAADAVLDAASLSLLESSDPASLRLLLLPGSHVLASAWPIATIHRAHQVEPDASPAAFDAVRIALDEGRNETVLVVREGWRATVHALDASSARWTRALLDGLCLDAAFAAAGDGFDFAAWLADALRGGWLKGVEPSND